MKPLEKLKLIQELQNLKKENKKLKRKLFLECLGKDKKYKVNIKGIKFNSSVVGVDVDFVIYMKELDEQQIIDYCKSQNIKIINIKIKDIEYDKL